eukprot:scaffold130311_cov32-Tisochrysis_lutea.AAC.1
MGSVRAGQGEEATSEEKEEDTSSSWAALFDHPACADAAAVVVLDVGDAAAQDESDAARPTNTAERDDFSVNHWEASQRRGVDRRGSYAREGGKGMHIGWARKAREHLAALAPCGSFFSSQPCKEKPCLLQLRGCARGGRCNEHVRPSDLLHCLIYTYGDPKLNEE